MITQKNITGTAWLAVTAAGKSGSCWLDEDDDGVGGVVDVRIYHSDAGEPAADKTTEGKRIYKPAANNDVCIISADNASDIYYAKCRNANDTAILTVDIV